MLSTTIRPMRRSDVAELLRLMAAIVAFERGSDFRLTAEDLLQRGFADRPEFGAFVADCGDGTLAGMAVHYEIPFMHTLQPLLMLKWLYVEPAHRRGQTGQRLVQALARHAASLGHGKFCWFVLKDNRPAQAFYRSLGASEDPEWDRWVLSGDAFEAQSRGRTDVDGAPPAPV